ncbi:hypothetical protein AVEN_173926-1 [Araneus ventricosus]|uniref:DUF4817 domain-containing protein n=1 Tax=Araneus ventricosus TaxID=182803 RepID=A0A4Y2PP31_ARAVE|nr:hypothetical protein AVEN_173926-1 [Araneus ventricosus]
MTFGPCFSDLPYLNSLDHWWQKDSAKICRKDRQNFKESEIIFNELAKNVIKSVMIRNKVKKKNTFRVLLLYKVPTQVLYHPFNYRMAAAIFIRVVSRHEKVTMRYWMKPLRATPGGKRWL